MGLAFYFFGEILVPEEYDYIYVFLAIIHFTTNKMPDFDMQLMEKLVNV